MNSLLCYSIWVGCVSSFGFTVFDCFFLFVCVIVFFVHYGPEQPKIQMLVLGYSFVRSLVCWRYSLIRFLHPACVACSLARSLIPELMG